MSDSNFPILSFPAILRNPNLVSPYAHLQAAITSNTTPTSSPAKLRQRDQNEGKRWTRRKDNAQFTGNPHIVLAAKSDYSIPTPSIQPTFPEPLPPYLPRNTKLPTVQLPQRDSVTANAGRFSLSLKGMRKTLRRSGYRTQVLVRDVENAISEWLMEGGAVLNPDNPREADLQDLMAHAMPIGELGIVHEVHRTPLRLIWHITDDAFSRYVVHCCARYHEVVSFSKEIAGFRLTYLLRPNVTRPDHQAPAMLDTPPITDVDYSSHLESEIDSLSLSDFSDRGVDSDVELSHGNKQQGVLTVIAENDGPSTEPPEINPPVSNEGQGVNLTATGNDLADNIETGSEVDYVAVRMPSLEVENSPPSEPLVGRHYDVEVISSSSTPGRLRIRYGQITSRRQIWGRSASSPSRSPARPGHRRRTKGTTTFARLYGAPKSTRAVLGTTKSQTLYDYLYT
ncbi:hypothetical protein AMATHDRAFT_4632 [Amanita thiersii Skay4041]|uniref:Uncharacterized protein n=1 Tax=Amanita thiersii Skay4041 TaxID=703135 RepID=A0A2A9NGN2_9AGAR|nr:hypothetical protein AMATHDRAFT_4632 [Amanita thiersii Skay4041]